MKGVKIEIKHPYAEGFVSLVDNLIVEHKFNDDDDKLMLAALLEIRHRFNVKMLKPQSQYTLTLTPAQALSIRVLYTGYINSVKTAMGNFLHTISNDVQKQYA